MEKLSNRERERTSIKKEFETVDIKMKTNRAEKNI